MSAHEAWTMAGTLMAVTTAIAARSPWSGGCRLNVRYRSHESAYGHWFMSTYASLCLSGISCQSGRAP